MQNIGFNFIGSCGLLSPLAAGKTPQETGNTDGQEQKTAGHLFGQEPGAPCAHHGLSAVSPQTRSAGANHPRGWPRQRSGRDDARSRQIQARSPAAAGPVPRRRRRRAVVWRHASAGGFFSKLSRQRLKHAAFSPLDDFIEPIETCIEHRNENRARAFRWSKQPQDPTGSWQRGCRKIDSNRCEFPRTAAPGKTAVFHTAAQPPAPQTGSANRFAAEPQYRK